MLASIALRLFTEGFSIETIVIVIMTLFLLPKVEGFVDDL